MIDAYVDAHKYVFGKRAVVYGEQDLVAAIASFLMEIGVEPVLCGSGAKTGRLRQRIAELDPANDCHVAVLEGVDFAEMEELRCGPQARFAGGQQQRLYHVAKARRAAGAGRLPRA